MDWTDRLHLFSTADIVAFILLFVAWFTIGYFIENPPPARPSVSHLMGHYRREWMRAFLDRNPRVFDAQILSNLRQGTAFFASATMIAIGGGLALIGNAEKLAGVAADFAVVDAPPIKLEIKILVMLILVANAFLKFVWAHRLFGYCSVVMSSVPNNPNDPKGLPRTEIAAEINITASRSFNRAMRSVYFGLAAATWIFGPWPLITASFITAYVLWRREFASHSRTALLRDRADT